MGIPNVIYHNRQRDDNLKFVDITNPRFYGSYKTSPNGEYAIGYSDSDYDGNCVGWRESGHGRFALLSGQNILVFNEAERPIDGQVADNGNFIINSTFAPQKQL